MVEGQHQAQGGVGTKGLCFWEGGLGQARLHYLVWKRARLLPEGSSSIPAHCGQPSTIVLKIRSARKCQETGFFPLG